MIITKSKDWKSFHQKSIKLDRYPKYPQELMLKTVFGGNSRFNLSINKKSKIIDIGCGFGNNLIPFIDLGAKANGVEIDKTICDIANSLEPKNLPIKKPSTMV